MRLTGTVLSQSAFRTGAEKTSPCAGFSQVVAASQSRVVFASDCGLPSERRMPQAGLLRRAKRLPPPGHPTRGGSRQRRAASGQVQRRAPRPAPEPWLPVGYEATPHDLLRRSLPTCPSATGARPACAEVLGRERRTGCALRKDIARPPGVKFPGCPRSAPGQKNVALRRRRNAGAAPQKNGPFGRLTSRRQSRRRTLEHASRRRESAGPGENRVAPALLCRQRRQRSKAGKLRGGIGIFARPTPRAQTRPRPRGMRHPLMPRRAGPASGNRSGRRGIRVPNVSPAPPSRWVRSPADGRSEQIPSAIPQTDRRSAPARGRCGSAWAWPRARRAGPPPWRPACRPW